MDNQDKVIHNLRGIMPRCFEHLFALIERETNKVLPLCSPCVNAACSPQLLCITHAKLREEWRDNLTWLRGCAVREQRGDKLKYLVTISYLEIYNETIFDLLDAGCSGLQLREDVKRGVFVRDLQELTVENAEEACEVGPKPSALSLSLAST